MMSLFLDCRASSQPINLSRRLSTILCTRSSRLIISAVSVTVRRQQYLHSSRSRETLLELKYWHHHCVCHSMADLLAILKIDVPNDRLPWPWPCSNIKLFVRFWARRERDDLIVLRWHRAFDSRSRQAGAVIMSGPGWRDICESNIIPGGTKVEFMRACGAAVLYTPGFCFEDTAACWDYQPAPGPHCCLPAQDVYLCLHFCFSMSVLFFKTVLFMLWMHKYSKAKSNAIFEHQRRYLFHNGIFCFVYLVCLIIVSYSLKCIWWTNA